MCNIFGAKIKELVEEGYQEVKFTIPGLTDNLSEFPIAKRIFKSATEIAEEDEIIVIQPSRDIQEYFFLPMNTQDFVGLYNLTNKIDITEENIIKIHVDEEKSKINIEDGNIIINNNNGDNEITMDSNYTHECKTGNVEIKASAGNIDIKASSGNVGIEASTGNVKLVSGATGTAEVGNTIATVGSLLTDICNALMSLHTEGSPATHTGAVWAASNITPILTKIPLVLT